MDIATISLVASGIVMAISFGMSVYGLYLQRTNLRLQRQEVREQNQKIIELLEEIASTLSSSQIS